MSDAGGRGPRTGKRRSAAPPPPVLDEHEHDRRVIQIQALLACGASEAEVVDWCTTLGEGEGGKNWVVGKAMAVTYLRRAYDAWRHEDKSKRAHYRRQYRAGANAIMRTAIEKGQLGNALRALDLLCKIDGVYEPERITVEVGRMSPAEQVRRIQHASKTLELARERGVLDGILAGDVTPPAEDGDPEDEEPSQLQ